MLYDDFSSEMLVVSKMESTNQIHGNLQEEQQNIRKK